MTQRPNFISILERDPRIDILAGSLAYGDVKVRLEKLSGKLNSGHSLDGKEAGYVDEIIRAMNAIHNETLTINGEDVPVRFGAPPTPGERFQGLFLNKKEKS